jgi:F-type H+-transporting ATPase subunit epsilon
MVQESVQHLQIDLITPEEIVQSTRADMVVIPGKEGEFAVLAQHAPMIASLKPGIVRIYTGQEISERVLITGGFVEITQERCTILADHAYLYSATSREEIEARVAAARKLHEEAEEEQEKLRALNNVHTTDALLEAFIRETDGRK